MRILNNQQPLELINQSNPIASQHQPINHHIPTKGIFYDLFFYLMNENHFTTINEKQFQF